MLFISKPYYIDTLQFLYCESTLQSTTSNSITDMSDDRELELKAFSLDSPNQGDFSSMNISNLGKEDEIDPSLIPFFEGKVGNISKAEIAQYLWLNPKVMISDEMVKKVNKVVIYLKEQGFELKGIKADGNCFCNAFLESYNASSRVIPILDDQKDPISYLKGIIASQYDAIQQRAGKASISRVQEIRQDGELLTADEGDLLAKALTIHIRILTVNLDKDGCEISDMLTFPEKDKDRQEWDTISESEKPKQYIFIVDLGGHFVCARSLSLISKYRAYFYNLNEEITDLFNAHRLIEKGHIPRPSTNLERGLELVLALFGIVSPGIGTFVRHAPHLIEHGMHLVKEVGEAGFHVHHFCHQGSKNHYKVASDLRGKQQLNAFINEIVQDLTYRFRHEILTLTEEEAEKLASMHYVQIKECLENIQKGEVKCRQDLHDKIINLIDPDPVEEIKKRIEEYITERKDRFFRSGNDHREKFLTHFLVDLQVKSSNIENLIHQISSEIFFKDYWYFWKEPSDICKTIADTNKHLSLSNCYIKELKKFQHNGQPITFEKDSQISYVFNNPFWTALFHTSMKSMSEKIILILMRSLTIKTMNEGHNREINKEISFIIQGLASKKNQRILLVEKRVVHLESQTQNCEKNIDLLFKQNEKLMKKNKKLKKQNSELIQNLSRRTGDTIIELQDFAKKI